MPVPGFLNVNPQEIGQYPDFMTMGTQMTRIQRIDVF